jgi:uncharacterized protein (TIGR00369 family)
VKIADCLHPQRLFEFGLGAAPCLSGGLDSVASVVGDGDYSLARVGARLPSPPIGELIHFVPIEYAAGRVVFQGTPGPKHYNPLGTVHGGYAATLLDSCLGCAIHSMLPAGKGYTTLELKVNYIRPLTDQTGPVRAERKVVTLGGQIGIAEGRLTDVTGKLYAFATTTCLVFSL